MPIARWLNRLLLLLLLLGIARPPIQAFAQEGSHQRVSITEGFGVPLGASAEEVRRIVLTPRELLVEYVEGQKRVYCYVLDEDILEIVDLGSREEIATELASFLGTMILSRSGAGPADVARTGQVLYERLLAPVLAVAPSTIPEAAVFEEAAVSARPLTAAP